MTMTHRDKINHKKRAIPPIIINWLRKFGCRITGMNGTTVIYFDKQSKRTMCSEVGHIVIRRLDDMMDAYVVMSEDKVIAVGHRFKPLRQR